MIAPATLFLTEYFIGNDYLALWVHYCPSCKPMLFGLLKLYGL